MVFEKPSLAPIELTIGQAEIDQYAAVTGDRNPIHVDPEFAAKTEMGGVIAHGTLSLNLIWQALERTLGREALASIALNVRFRRPVRVGDRIQASGALSDDGASYRVWAVNQNGDNVIDGTATFAQANEG